MTEVVVPFMGRKRHRGGPAALSTGPGVPPAAAAEVLVEDGNEAKEVADAAQAALDEDEGGLLMPPHEPVYVEDDGGGDGEGKKSILAAAGAGGTASKLQRVDSAFKLVGGFFVSCGVNRWGGAQSPPTSRSHPAAADGVIKRVKEAGRS